MNNVIKRHVSHQTNLGKLVFFVLRVERKIIYNMKKVEITNSEVLQHIKEVEELSTLNNLV